jgi:hypothetical protein
VELLSGVQFKGRLLTSTATVRFGCSISVKKFFITLSPNADVIKHFSSTQTKRKNKLVFSPGNDFSA